MPKSSKPPAESRTAKTPAGGKSTAKPGRRKILVLHGPNLNLLGTREPTIYGRETLNDINARLKHQGKEQGAAVDCFQSNYEGALVERIHAAKSEQVAFIVINPGALTHTSVALRDALTGVGIPFIEVHISNVHARESFRHVSFLSAVAVGVMCGLGSRGYDYALQFALTQPNN